MFGSLVIQVSFFFLLPFCYAQIGSRGKSHPAFGAPAKFNGQQLPTNLEVGKHFLWTYEQMTSTHGVTVSHHEVAQQVLTSCIIFTGTQLHC